MKVSRAQASPDRNSHQTSSKNRRTTDSNDSDEVVGGITSFYIHRADQFWGGYGLVFTHQRIVGLRDRKRRFAALGLGLSTLLIVSILEFYYWGVFPLDAWINLPNASPPRFWPLIIPILSLTLLIVLGDLVDFIMGMCPLQFEEWLCRLRSASGLDSEYRSVSGTEAGTPVVD